MTDRSNACLTQEGTFACSLNSLENFMVADKFTYNEE